MSKVYTFLHKLEKLFPNIIFELDYDKNTYVGKITISDRNYLQTKRIFEIHYYLDYKGRGKRELTFFDDESGKRVNLLKEIRNFDVFIKMNKDFDIILRI